MAPFGCGGLNLFDRLLARRLIHYRLRQRVYVHTSMMLHAEPGVYPLWISN